MQFKGLPHKKAFHMAWPMILSNISAPLMGIVDTAMLGHLESPLYLGAVAIGANILALLLWMFAFLRMGTTSFVGRAFGAGDTDLLQRQLGQSMALAVIAGFALIALQWLIVPIAIGWMAPNPEIAELATRYCHIRITAAPAAFITFVVIGLLIGLQNTRLPLVITVAANALNIGLDVLFIMVFDWKSDGAAWATLIAEVFAGILALWLGGYALRRYLNIRWQRPSLQSLLDGNAWAEQLRLHGDLFIRTALLLFIFNFFTAQSGQLGPVVLAGNAILMQLVLFQSFGLDGYAHAAEAMGAKALGEKDLSGFKRSCGANFSAAIVLALVVSAGLLLVKQPLIGLFTNITAVAESITSHYHWLVLFPLVSVWAYILDGIFIGAGKTRIMLLTMVVAVFAGFLPLWWCTQALLNHGLWITFLIFNTIRGASLGWAFYTLSARHKWF